MTDTKHGAGHLLARVAVNRLWHHHLGRGIVSTPNDFGFQGARPTHPELLDWLAVKLIENGWRLKPIHKLIMTSAVYTQGSRFDESSSGKDPENDFCGRFSPRRLEAENAALRSLTDMVPDPRLRFITARVVGDQGGAFARSILVNAGSRDGVAKGQARCERAPELHGLGQLRPSVFGEVGNRYIVKSDDREAPQIPQIGGKFRWLNLVYDPATHLQALNGCRAFHGA